MKKNVKRLILFFVCIMLVFSSSLPAFATNNNNKNKSRSFKDVQKGYWAYDDIMWMLDRNIIEGVGNGAFSPNSTVSRSEFAKMMVNTLNLQRYSPDTPSFLDVKKNSWEYQYVEAAKAYLTGFRTSGGDYYKPSQSAVREDMTVALVKALGYQNETADESILNRFADAGQISPNLRKYVALSVKHGLVEGYSQNGQTIFNPQGNLTRAEAATLLHRAFKYNEEKITYDEDKVTYDDNTYIKPSVSVSTDNNKLIVSWNKISSTQLAGYMVVVSMNDSTPAYPDNGYLYYITDKNQTSAVIDNSTPYNGTSDFGKYLEKDKKYYISVTAVYNDRVIAGSAVRKTYPGANDPGAYIAPVVYITIENGKLVLKWNKIDSSYFDGYKVVISKNSSSPKYPDNGYLYYITDKNTTSAVIDNRSAYNGNSDFGQYLVKGQTYYFSVTAAYDDRNVAGNAVQYVYPGNGDEYLYPAPVVYTSMENGNLVLRWNRIATENFREYRVVISKNNTAPKYPDNGYLCSISDRDRCYAVINNSDKYNNGDFGNYLTKGEKYYISVTAIYKDRNIAGNTVQFQYDGTENPESYVMPVMSAAEENGRLVLRWNKIESPNLVSYRVVASKTDSSPSYPENGYQYSITDRNRNYAVIDSTTAYTGGDFGSYLIKGEEYYFSITAVYKDRNVTGNTIRCKYNGDDNPALFPVPVVSAMYDDDGNLIVKWNKIDSSQLVEYRLVISQNNQTPAYPANGFYNTSYDKNTTSAVIDVSKPSYTNGDFTALTDGTEYYFSVTAVYSNNKYVAGNAVKVLYLLPAKQ